MDELIVSLLIATIIILIINLKSKKKKNVNPETKPIEPKQIESEPKIIEKESYTEETIYPYKKKYLLTKNEYYFYNKLKEITSPLNLQILAKIRLADLIEVDNTQAKSEWMKYFAKIKAKHVDFAIADNMKIIALLELDDNSHNNTERKERDSFVNNALLKAGYTVIRTNGNMNVIQQALIDKGYHMNLYQNTQ